VTGHTIVERVLLGADTHPKIDGGVAPDWFPQNADRALARLELAGEQLEQRRFSCTVRSKEARHAAANGQRHVVQPDDLTVPL
jgi:hypothetical protein